MHPARLHAEQDDDRIGQPLHHHAAGAGVRPARGKYPRRRPGDPGAQAAARSASSRTTGREQLEHGKFDFIRGLAHFTGEHRVDPPAGGRRGTRHAPAAARSRRGRSSSPPARKVADVPIPGLEEIGYLTSDDVARTGRVPAVGHRPRGGGHRAGSEPPARGPGLRGDASSSVAARSCARPTRTWPARWNARSTAQGVRFHCGSHLLRAEIGPADGQKRVWFERGGREHSVAAQEILFALGRSPAPTVWNSTSPGSKRPRRAASRSAPTSGRSQRHIFAAGDVCGPYEIVHIAIQQAEIAARNAARHLGKLDGPPEEIDYRLKLFALFTEPQMAHVGLTEKEARARRARLRAWRPTRSPTTARRWSEARRTASSNSSPTAPRARSSAARRSGRKRRNSSTRSSWPCTSAARRPISRRCRITIPTLSEIWTYPAEELAG